MPRRGKSKSPMQFGFAILTFAWMAMIFSGIQICQAEPSDESEQIQVTRWMDPTGRLPVTYSDWNSIQPPHRNAIEMVRPPTQPVPPSTGVLRVLIRDTIYPSLTAAIGQYVDDLTAQGYTVLTLVGDFATPTALRAWLQAEYASSQILGAVIIGDWPVPWYEMDDDFDDQHAEFPCDLYYMDLDGTWGDGDTDGLFDTHVAGSGDVGPEIWIGRLTFSPLTYTGATEVELLDAYFDKNHRYRTGQLCQTGAALAYNDDDWDTFADTCGELDLCLTYGSGDVTFVTDPETTTAADYKTRFVQNREFIHVMSHGSPGGHGFYENSQEDFNWVSVADVISLDPQANYYNLFVCSGCRYVETDYVGGWYINGSYGLVSIGSTKTGSMLTFPEFYTPLSTGVTMGDAFKTWFEGRAASGFEQWERQWFYGMTLIGDPTLGPKATTPDPYEMNNSCAAAQDLGTVTTQFSSEIAHFYDADQDWFRFDIDNPGTIIIDTTLYGTSADTVITLYNTCGGAPLAANDDYNGLASHIEYSGLAGTYYLQIDQYGQYYGMCRNYSFTIAMAVVVNFPDPGLEAAIRDAIGKPVGDIYDTDLAGVGLTTLDASARSISNLEGIQYCTDLTTLYLGNNQLVNIGALSGLTSLITLHLYNNEIADISPLSGLINLAQLELYQNEIVDISALSGLINLTWLDLDTNQIVDISALSSLISLTELSLGRNQISALSALSGLTNLSLLYMAINEIVDISALSGLTNLTLLYMAFNHIVDITPLAGLTNLTRLALFGSEIVDISPLAGMTNLISLDLSSNHVVDISPLAGLTNLTSLDLNYDQIIDISPLAGLTNLTRLLLRDNQIIDISPLAGLTTLTWLSLNSNQVVDISSIAGLTNLTELELNHTQIADISPLSGLSNLARLYAGGNEIVDITALVGLTNLAELALWDNQIADLSPLLSNVGIDSGDDVDVRSNQLLLSPGSHDMLAIEALQGRGVNVVFDPQNPPANTSAVFRVDNEGNVFADQPFYGATFTSGAADVAEWISVSGQVEPGDVVEFDPIASVQYRIAQNACSSLVAGVISTTPGVTLGTDLDASEKALLALVGIVPVKVTDEGGPIQPGDLLVTSSTLGHAMRWAGPGPCLCSLVGKALEPMNDETGVILVLLTAH